MSLELKADLTGARPAAGFHVDFPKSSGIEIQFGSARSGVIEDVAHIETNGNIPGFINPDSLLEVGIEIPASRAIDWVQSQRA